MSKESTNFLFEERYRQIFFNTLPFEELIKVKLIDPIKNHKRFYYSKSKSDYHRFKAKVLRGFNVTGCGEQDIAIKENDYIILNFPHKCFKIACDMAGFTLKGKIKERWIYDVYFEFLKPSERKMKIDNFRIIKTTYE